MIPKKGESYLLTYTRPIYDPTAKHFQPDNLRFNHPTITEVIYGGHHTGVSRHCLVCGRMCKTYHVFIRASDFMEIYVSDHCFTHPSTRVWWGSPLPSEDTIQEWYDMMDREMGGII